MKSIKTIRRFRAYLIFRRVNFRNKVFRGVKMILFKGYLEKYGVLLTKEEERMMPKYFTNYTELTKADRAYAKIEALEYFTHKEVDKMRTYLDTDDQTVVSIPVDLPIEYKVGVGIAAIPFGGMIENFALFNDPAYSLDFPVMAF